MVAHSTGNKSSSDKKAQLDDKPAQRRLLLLLQLQHPVQFVAGKEPSFNQPFGKTQLRVHESDNPYLPAPGVALP